MAHAARTHLPTSFAAPELPVPVRPMLFNLHGYGVSLLVEPNSLRHAAMALLVDCVEQTLPFGAAIEGSVLPYDEADVLRCVSSDAVAVREGDPHYHPLLELFRSPDGVRWWLVDERWGLCEIDLVRRSWRSFVLPEPSIDPVRLFEATVWWPMAQLLRGFGLHLLPAASFGLADSRSGSNRGVLILASNDLGPEMVAAPQWGLGIIGQRWTALREEADGRMSLLAMPGRTEIAPTPRLLSAGGIDPERWVDASASSRCAHAYCETVLIAEPMRRGRASAVALETGAALKHMKDAWPMPSLGPKAAVNPLPSKLARRCAVYRTHLGRNGRDLLRLLLGEPATPSTTPPRVAA